IVKKVLRLRDFGNNVIKIIGGRTVHPITPKVGGWYKKPTKEALEEIKKDNKNALIYSKVLIDLISSLKMPTFERKTEYIAYSPIDKYIGYNGEIKSSDGWSVKEEEFKNEIEEYQEEDLVVKLTSHNGKSYATDALARLHLNSSKLHPKAKKALQNSALKIPNYNPFYNILAQSIEVMHLVEETQKIIKELENMRWKNLNTDFKVRSGEGAAILEAPRGILYHYYKIDNKGVVMESDVITPTAQLLVNLNDDLKEYLPKVKKYKKEKREHEILKLVHAYDPCISCSVH
ncbi:MAG: nickel-dependent hydrogenase large subunit, partial [Candidatus Pacebacteria bacterium]|nr:nickel-dependent hydrogenase large subunit [Candidatus Paceibacterota bacterium]